MKDVDLSRSAALRAWSFLCHRLRMGAQVTFPQPGTAEKKLDLGWVALTHMAPLLQTLYVTRGDPGRGSGWVISCQVCVVPQTEYKGNSEGWGLFRREIRSQKAAPSGSLFPADLRRAGRLVALCYPSLNLAQTPSIFVSRHLPN